MKVCLIALPWSREELRTRFVDKGRMSQDELRALLDGWNEMRLLYREGERFEGCRFLALAPAFTPQMAARRLREAHEAEQRERSRPGGSDGEPRRPAVVALPVA